MILMWIKISQAFNIIKKRRNMVSRIFLKALQYAVIIVCLSACSSDSNPLENEDQMQYAMFFLADSSLSYFDIENTPISDLQLCETPFLTYRDIDTLTVFYLENNPVQSYALILKNPASAAFASDVKPFLLMLAGSRYSICEFWPAMMSIIPKSIVMFRFFDNRYDIHPGDSAGNQKLKNPQIFEILQNAGVHVIYENIGK